MRGLVTVAGISFRNLTRQKKATFLLAGVIAFGIMIVSLMQGCAGSIMSNVSANMANMMGGHIFVQGEEQMANGRSFSIIRDDAKLMEAWKASGLKADYISKRAQFRASISFEGNSASEAVSGVDFAKERYLLERLHAVDGKVDNIKSTPNGIILTDSIAKNLKVKAGDQILVKLQTFTGQENVGDFSIVALIHDVGGGFSNSGAYANLEYVDTLLNLPENSYQTLTFFLPDMKRLDADGELYYKALQDAGVQLKKRAKATDNSQSMIERLRGGKTEHWSGTRFAMTTLNDELSGVQTLVNTINVVSIVILIILFVIVMVGITNTFRMIMLDRIKEIGTMRALGMQKGQVRSLFLLEALFLALAGAVAGLILAGLVMLGISFINIGVDSPFALLLKNGHMTFNLSPLLILANIAIIAVLTLLSAMFPARNAANMEPAHALRTAK
jgi:putative ABC transport system permease protein